MNSKTDSATRSERLDAWQLYFDPAGATAPAQLPADWREQAVGVTVPHVWEQVRPNYDGVGWYRRVLRITAGELTETWRVRFSAVHYRAEVFLNGHFLIRHDGGYTPFVAELTSHLQAGENELLVRVVDPPREYPVEGLQSSHPLRQTALPTYKAGWYYSFGGLWQPVHVLRTAAVWLEDAFVQPRLNPRSIRVEFALGTSGGVAVNGKLRYHVTRVGETASIAAGEISASAATGSFELALPDAPLWSCETPNLLTLHVEFTGASGVDARSWRFGLREFTTDGERFLLNGRPIHLRGVLHQGGFPRTIAFPQDEAMARKDIRSILDAGCNLSRITLRPASMAELDLCDELGLLVIGEPPIGWVAYDDEIDARCLREVEEMIRRDRNRPSVVMWTLLNEFSDTVYFKKKSPSALIEAACKLGLSLDPTRLMTGNSGRGVGEAVSGNGIFGQGKPSVPIQDEHIYLRNFPSAAELDTRIVSVGKDEPGLLFVSEFGTSAFPDLDRVLANYPEAERALGLEDYQQMKNYRDEIVKGWEGFGLKRFFATREKFYYALGYDQAEMVRLEQRALRLNPRVAGYVITQGADASSEFGGIVDLWREPKRVYAVYRELNRKAVLLLDTPGRFFSVGTSVPLRVVVSNFSEAPQPAVGWIALLHADREVRRWEFSGAADWSSELLAAEINLESAGDWALHAEASCGGQLIVDKVTLRALPAPRFAGTKILLMDSSVGPHGAARSEIGGMLAGLGLETVKFGNQANAPGLPVLVHLRGRDRTLNYFENQRVLRREVEAGRTAVFVDCDLAYLHYFFGEDTPREIYGNGAFAGNMGFAFDDALFAHLGPEHQIGPAYGACYPRIHPEAHDVQKAGGEILALHAMPYQFGRPDTIEWGATLYTKAYGKGRVWVCSFRLFEAIAAKDAVAVDLLDRLLEAAKVATTGIHDLKKIS
ncbi:glycoside hydrolase family 2 protein [Oleiharenicola lentus]|uniref:glycoside hydrolase family 2 protein n=1 Tax=Oleiharenicola lentus TaxID=2508720 RepID=UPI003F6616D7